ncbi:MAG: PP2C family protein-serine/threonine phosphatase [Bauldia sp.]
MSIRQTLLLLTTFLGVALLAAILFHVQRVVEDYRNAADLQVSNEIRDGLIVASGLIAAERSATFAALISVSTVDRAAIDAAREPLDLFRSEAGADLRSGRAGGENADEVLVILLEAGARLDALRIDADRMLATGTPEERRTAARRWFDETSAIVANIQSFRLVLLSREEPLDSTLRATGLLRYFIGIVREALSQNGSLVAAATSGPIHEPWVLERALQNAGRQELGWQMIREQLPAPLDSAVVRSLLTAVREYNLVYAPLERRLLIGLVEDIAADAGDWEAAVATATTLQGDALAVLLANASALIETHLSTLNRALIGWILLSLAGAAAVGASILVVRNRVVRPLDDVRRTMLRLADDDLSPEIPKSERGDEVGAMTEALRVFKANAIRRRRLEAQKDALGQKLEEAYATLRTDLDAAASVQQAMLPTASELHDVRIHSLFRASNVIAGDTFNVFPSGDELVFFHIDVAGHGAAAALVSMASRHVLTVPAGRVVAGEPIESIVAEINREWPESLPYFTMVYGAINVRRNTGRLVQAGHPKPFLLSSTGAIATLGDGGIPIGLFPDSVYEPVRFDFGPHDRLFLYSDGVTEARNAADEQFSDERLERLLRSAAGEKSEALLGGLERELVRWTSDHDPEDDVSVLVLERTGEERTAH